MPAAYSTITITDGTTTATLTDLTNYGLLTGGWAPQVPVRRASTLGGAPYTEVSETIELDVFGATAAAALANLRILVTLIDTAERWYRGENTTPVTITYQAQGSDLDPLTSLILGFEGDRGALDLPATFNDELMNYTISNVQLRFRRVGVWYGDEESDGTDPAEHPVVMPGAFAYDSPVMTPVQVTITDLPDQTHISYYDAGFLLVAATDDRLQVIDATDFDFPGNGYTTDADATRHPEGTGVLIYTPAVTTEVLSALGAITLPTTTRRIGIVANLRNTHATTTFRVRVEVSGSGGRGAVYTRPYIVDTSTTDPRIVSLGTVLCEDASLIRLRVTASAAAGTLVIDYLALVALDDPTSRMLAIGPFTPTASIPAPEESGLTVDPQWLTARSPRVRLEGLSFADSYAIPDYWRGDAYLLSIGDAIAGVYCGRNASGGYWGLYDPVDAVNLETTMAFARQASYLVPE